jgi:hypothetical protein
MPKYNDPYPCVLCGKEVHRGGRIIQGYRVHRACVRRIKPAVQHGRPFTFPTYLEISGDGGGTFVLNPLVRDDARGEVR